MSSGHLDEGLGDRLARAAGFRNILVHTYETLDMTRVHEAATKGPDHLRAFLGQAATLLERR